MFRSDVPETRPSLSGTAPAASEPGEAWLEIVRGRARNRIRRLETETFLIGSAPERNLVLADAAVPSLHSFIYRTETRLVVCHLGEEPPLLINGYRATRMALEAGDRITVGPFELAVHMLPPRGPAVERRGALANHVQRHDARERVALLCTDVISAMEQARSALRLYPEPGRAGDACRGAVPGPGSCAPERRAATGNG